MPPKRKARGRAAKTAPKKEKEVTEEKTTVTSLPNSNFVDSAINDRNTTGVLSSRPDAMDIKIDSLSLSYK
eukprot:Pgem_evm1s20228